MEDFKKKEFPFRSSKVFKDKEEVKQEETKKEEIKQEEVAELEKPVQKENQESNSLVSYEEIANTQALFESTVRERIANGEDLSSLSNQLAHVRIASDLMNEDDSSKFKKTIKGTKAEEITQSFKQKVESEKAKTLESKNRKAEAFYNGSKPFFKFFKLDEYASLGFMIFLMFIGLIPYMATKFIQGVLEIITVLINGINDIAIAISGFSKPAKIIVGAVFFIGAAILTLFGLVKVLESIFQIQIIPTGFIGFK